MIGSSDIGHSSPVLPTILAHNVLSFPATRAAPCSPFFVSSNLHSFLPASHRQCAAKNPPRCSQNQGHSFSTSVFGTASVASASREKNSNRPSRCAGGTVNNLGFTSNRNNNQWLFPS